MLEGHKRANNKESFSCVHCDKNSASDDILEDYERTHTVERRSNNSEEENKSRKVINCNIMSWNIGRGLGSLTEIKHVIAEEDIGICFLIETDEY